MRNVKNTLDTHVEAGARCIIKHAMRGCSVKIKPNTNDITNRDLIAWARKNRRTVEQEIAQWYWRDLRYGDIDHRFKVRQAQCYLAYKWICHYTIT